MTMMPLAGLTGDALPEGPRCWKPSSFGTLRRLISAPRFRSRDLHTRPQFAAPGRLPGVGHLLLRRRRLALGLVPWEKQIAFGIEMPACFTPPAPPGSRRRIARRSTTRRPSSVVGTRPAFAGLVPRPDAVAAGLPACFAAGEIDSTARAPQRSTRLRGLHRSLRSIPFSSGYHLLVEAS